PPSSRCWLTLFVRGAWRATSHVERLSSSATNNVADAVSARAAGVDADAMGSLLIQMSGPEPTDAQPSVAPEDLSAPFTLWLSTMAVVGLASLPTISRACS